MGREDYNINDQKYNDALNSIIHGESNISAIARDAGIDWKTAKKLYQDPDTHALIAAQSHELIKNSTLKVTRLLMDKAEASSSELVQLDAIKHVLALAGMNPVIKQEIKQEVTNSGHLSDILHQINKHQTSNTTSLQDDEE